MLNAVRFKSNYKRRYKSLSPRRSLILYLACVTLLQAQAENVKVPLESRLSTDFIRKKLCLYED